MVYRIWEKSIQTLSKNRMSPMSLNEIFSLGNILPDFLFPVIPVEVLHMVLTFTSLLAAYVAVQECKARDRLCVVCVCKCVYVYVSLCV